jgi:hypothetical protein
MRCIELVRLVLVLGLVVGLVVGIAFMLAPDRGSSSTRLKSFTFCGPETCWSTPATATRGRDVFAIGHAAQRPAVPVRFYRVRLQYAPTGRSAAVFVPSRGLFRRNDGHWLKVPRETAQALRRYTRLLRAFGPQRL